MIASAVAHQLDDFRVPASEEQDALLEESECALAEDRAVAGIPGVDHLAARVAGLLVSGLAEVLEPVVQFRGIAKELVDRHRRDDGGQVRLCRVSSKVFEELG